MMRAIFGRRFSAFDLFVTALLAVVLSQGYSPIWIIPGALAWLCVQVAVDRVP